MLIPNCDSRSTPGSPLGLGIDAGGTQTRWALADAGGAIVADGTVAGLSALQMTSSAGRDAVYATCTGLAAAVLVMGHPTAICAGLTGLGSDHPMLVGWLSALFAIAPPAISLRSDIEIAYLDNFAPGAGYLVYAGTGSIAAWIDVDGVFHRAGGRGVLLDDGGGGYAIARAALRHIWRREDEDPGAWQDSPLARAVFEHIGGADWSHTRQFMYGQERGAIGQLALAVAASADTDPVAHQILHDAGGELARLALALVARCGVRPIVLAGRASTLHPVIALAMRAALPPELTLRQRVLQSHHAAARIAVDWHPCP